MINNVGLSDHVVMTFVLTTDAAWSLISLILNEQIKQHIPRSVHRKDKRRNIWMTREATAKHKRKQQAWKRYRQSGDCMDYICAMVEKNEFTTVTRNL